MNVPTAEISGHEARDKLRTIQELEKEIAKLRKQMKLERQFNRKMEYNSKLQKLKKTKAEIMGLVGEQLNDASVKAIGKALGEQIKKRGAKRVSVGYDARTHAPMLFSALVSGLNAQGLELFDIGLAPTPVGYFSVFSGEFDANVMITGSHNPKEYNGFKITIGTDSFFGKDLEALGAVVESMLKADPSSANIPTDKRAQKFDILSKYEDFYAKNFSHLKGFALPFVCDFGNGAAGGRSCQRSASR